MFPMVIGGVGSGGGRGSFQSPVSVLLSLRTVVPLLMNIMSGHRSSSPVSTTALLDELNNLSSASLTQGNLSRTLFGPATPTTVKSSLNCSATPFRPRSSSLSSTRDSFTAASQSTFTCSSSSTGPWTSFPKVSPGSFSSFLRAEAAAAPGTQV